MFGMPCPRCADVEQQLIESEQRAEVREQELSRLRAEVAQMRWRPIATAPKDGTDVLVWGVGTYTVASWNGSEWRDIGDIGWGGMYGDDNQPTHWMPLPKAPAALGGEGGNT